MGTKNLILLLILASVLFCGCLTPEEERLEETEISEEMGEAAEANHTEMEISEEKESAEKPVETERVNETENLTGIKGPGISEKEIEDSGLEKPEPRTYLVMLKYHLMRPPELEINKGDTVAWRNMQEPKRFYTLTSEEALFDNANLVYGRSFTQTFNESGTYNFSVIGQPKMKMTITVK